VGPFDSPAVVWKARISVSQDRTVLASRASSGTSTSAQAA
jgi:hypothetical protein